MIDAGVRFTLSDDSHGPDDVGMHYAKLRAFLTTVGIADVYCVRPAYALGHHTPEPTSARLGAGAAIVRVPAVAASARWPTA